MGVEAAVQVPVWLTAVQLRPRTRSCSVISQFGLYYYFQLLQQCICFLLKRLMMSVRLDIVCVYSRDIATDDAPQSPSSVCYVGGGVGSPASEWVRSLSVG